MLYLNDSIKLPYYIRAVIFLTGIFLFVIILSEVQSILLPLIYAAMISILIDPSVKFLTRKGMNKALAIIILLLICMIFIVVISLIMAQQSQKIIDAWPQIVLRLRELTQQLVAFVTHNFGLNLVELNSILDRARDEMISIGSDEIGNTFTTIGGIATTIMLLPVYCFLLLYYQQHLIQFIYSLFGSNFPEEISDVLTKSKSLIQHYLFGLFIQFLILSVLNSTGLFLLGIKYSILLGLLGGLLNIIPYLGAMITACIYMCIALVTKTPEFAVYVIIMYAITQFLDNNFIVPKIIGSKLKLNALVSIIAVISGASLWGLPGMFLSIPLLAIIKLILDHMDSQKYIGKFLGEP